MKLSAEQKRVILQILNVFETGSVQGNYADISIFHDGPDGRRQITYGRSQTTEYGHLRELVTRYCDAPNAHLAALLRPYLARIGHVPLVDDAHFKDMLEDAGEEDPVMHAVQDAFFDDVYFRPAKLWAEERGFTYGLSMLVIYDSFIHSGGILSSLRAKFPEVPPAQGGDERTWIERYTRARHTWLRTHPRTILHSTVYRTQCFLTQIDKSNWHLSDNIDAHGVTVRGASNG